MELELLLRARDSYCYRALTQRLDPAAITGVESPPALGAFHQAGRERIAIVS